MDAARMLTPTRWIWAKTVGAVGDSQVPPDRTRPRVHHPRHGCARRQGNHHGANNYLGRIWNGAPIFITVEGANILSRNLMIFGQGAIRCHPFVLKEMALAGREDKDQALIEFDGLLLKHIGFAVSNAASTLVLNLGFGHLEHMPGDKLSQGYFRALNRQAAAFALLADLSMMLLGGELKRRERLSARLGDVLSNLYLASAALKRYTTSTHRST
jgi:acyl-CoA dehydrogenase